MKVITLFTNADPDAVWLALGISIEDCLVKDSQMGCVIWLQDAWLASTVKIRLEKQGWYVTSL